MHLMEYSILILAATNIISSIISFTFLMFSRENRKLSREVIETNKEYNRMLAMDEKIYSIGFWNKTEKIDSVFGNLKKDLIKEENK